MGNKGSSKINLITHETNTRECLKKCNKSFGSKSVDNFLDVREDVLSSEKSIPLGRNVTKLEVKIFRSYTNLNEFGSKRNIFDDKPTNIRIYKKSSQKFDHNTFQCSNEEKILRQISRSSSLPKSFGKSKNRRSTVSASYNGHINSLKDGRYSRISLQNTQATMEDFTSSLALKERLKLFEGKLVDAILTKFTSFSMPFQTSLIPLALFPPCGESALRAHSLLTLKCYLEDMPDERFDLIQASSVGHCALFFPPSCLEGLGSLNENSSTENISYVARSLFHSMSEEAARDLGRMYEYQIGLLTSDFSIDLLTSFIADRIVSYITHDMKVPLVDRNSILMGALKGRINKKNLSPAVVSVILGRRELKWDVYEIIDKPGLRKSIMVYQDDEILPDGPFQFFSSSSSDYMTYGYRGQLFELDFSKGIYKHHKPESDEFNDEVLWRYDDIHRKYPPYSHNIGDKLFKRFLIGHDPAKIQQGDLNDYIKKLLAPTIYFREDIMVSLMPLNRDTLPDETIINFVNPTLTRRIPARLTAGSNTPNILATPVPQDFPTSDNCAASRHFFTSTSCMQGGSCSLQSIFQKSPPSPN